MILLESSSAFTNLFPLTSHLAVCITSMQNLGVRWRAANMGSPTQTLTSAEMVTST